MAVAMHVSADPKPDWRNVIRVPPSTSSTT
jgi:hypothetical protein